MVKRKGAYYVDNDALRVALREYRKECKVAAEQGKERPHPNAYIIQNIILIAKKLSTRSSFNAYSYLDEMQQDAIQNAIQYGVHSYDPDRPFTPFAYFTRIMWSAFIRRIELEAKQHYVKLMIGMDHQQEETLADNSYLPAPFEENQNDFIKRFETKNAKKKTKRMRVTGVEVFIERKPKRGVR